MIVDEGAHLLAAVNVLGEVAERTEPRGATRRKEEDRKKEKEKPRSCILVSSSERDRVQYRYKTV